MKLLSFWELFFLLLAIGVIGAFVVGCASPPDMSRREAIGITNLAKELTR